MDYIVTALISYLFGSIPFGYLFTKILLKKDIRNVGSGNIGATNVLRTGNKKLALLTLILDFSKSFLPLFIFFKFIKDFLYLGPLDHLNLDEDALTLLFGYFFILGHCYPIWLKFKGGKGVATFFGILLFLQAKLFLIAVVIWGLVFILKKTSSIAALLCINVTFITNFVLFDSENLVINLICILILLMHHQNIYRIVKGKEKKIT